MKHQRAFLVFWMILGVLLWGPPASLYADDVQNINYLERGFFRIFTAVFQLPIYLVQKTLNGPPVAGTVDGVLSGAFYTVSSLMGGAFDIARGAIPYAKYLIFLA